MALCLSFLKKYSSFRSRPGNRDCFKASNDGIRTIPKFFDQKLAEKIVKENGKAKIILTNNAFAHMDNLKEIMQGIKTLMNTNSLFVLKFHI